jgi:hypothetical protein
MQGSLRLTNCVAFEPSFLKKQEEKQEATHGDTVPAGSTVSPQPIQSGYRDLLKSG